MSVRSSYAAFLIVSFARAAAPQPAVVGTILNERGPTANVLGRLQTFLSTSFQPAEWDYTFFQQHPSAALPLWKLAPRHIRVQPISQGVPQKTPTQWDFSQLDSVLVPVLSVGDHSPELQIATAPTFMNDSQGHLTRDHFQDFANYSANLVRYYNQGGFDAGGVHYQSPTPYHITWWGIFNEPNINGLSGDDYVDLYNLVVPVMQAVDPAIQFVAIELSDFDVEPQKMLPPFVGRVNARVDAVSTHYYGSCNQSDTDQSIFDAVAQFTAHVNYIYSQLRTNPTLARIPVWVMENNVNADYDEGNGVSACNGNTFVADPRGSSAFFAAWRPLVFSQLAQAGAESLYHWDYDSDVQYGEVDFDTGNTYLSYWVDYYLGHFFPSPPGGQILQVNNTDPANVEMLAVRNDDGSSVVMVANHAVRSQTDNNGPGAPRTVTLNVAALGSFADATQLTIDAATDPIKGPVPVSITPAAQLQFKLNGYGVSFVRFNAAKPRFSASAVVNAASYEGGAVSPGEIVAIFGVSMGPGNLAGAQISSPDFLDNFLAGTRIYFDGIAAPLVYTSAKQVGAIVPYEVAGKASTQMQVEYLGAFSDPVNVPVAEAVPGIFTGDFSGTGQGAILNQDGTLNSVTNPAERNSVVSLYATGEGQTAPAGIDGRIASGALTKPASAVKVTIGGISAEVTYAGGAQGLVAGGMQINARIPADLIPGSAIPLTISVGDINSRAGVTIAAK
jgi:uncharacterized protein (TIGR03437 family)